MGASRPARHRRSVTEPSLSWDDVLRELEDIHARNQGWIPPITYEHVSARLGVKPGTVRTRFNRYLRSLEATSHVTLSRSDVETIRDDASLSAAYDHLYPNDPRPPFTSFLQATGMFARTDLAPLFEASLSKITSVCQCRSCMS